MKLDRYRKQKEPEIWNLIFTICVGSLNKMEMMELLNVEWK